jgi:hypothetical protein
VPQHSVDRRDMSAGTHANVFGARLCVSFADRRQ